MKTPMQELIEKFETIQKNDCKTVQEVVFFDGVLAICDGFVEKEKKAICDAYTEGEELIYKGLRKMFPNLDFSEAEKEIKKIKEGIKPNKDAEKYYSKLIS